MAKYILKLPETETDKSFIVKGKIIKSFIKRKNTECQAQCVSDFMQRYSQKDAVNLKRYAEEEYTPRDFSKLHKILAGFGAVVTIITAGCVPVEDAGFSAVILQVALCLGSMVFCAFNLYMLTDREKVNKYNKALD